MQKKRKIRVGSRAFKLIIGLPTLQKMKMTFPVHSPAIESADNISDLQPIAFPMHPAAHLRHVKAPIGKIFSANLKMNIRVIFINQRDRSPGANSRRRFKNV